MTWSIRSRQKSTADSPQPWHPTMVWGKPPVAPKDPFRHDHGMNQPLYPRPAPKPERPFSDLIVDIVAITGGVLVMAASIAAAAARWGTLSVTARLLVLGAVLLAVTAASELLAKRIPTVGGVLIHLSACLVLPTAIASVAQLTGTWRECIAIGGVAGGFAVWAQGRRKQAPLLTGATAIGGVISAGGLAALTGVPVAVFIGVMAVSALSIGWTRRATCLAGVASALPLATISAQLHIGPGTLQEMGAVGPHVSLGALIGGALAGAVLTRISVKQQSRPHAWGAAAAFATVALAIADLVDLARFQYVLPGLAFIAIQLLVGFVERSGKVKPELQLPLLVDVSELVAFVPLLMVFTTTGVSSAIGGALIAVGFVLGALRTRELPALLPALGATVFGSVSVGMQFGVEWGLWSAVVISALTFWAIKETRWISVSTAIIPLAALCQMRSMQVDSFVIATVLGIVGAVCLGVSAAVKPNVQPISVMGMVSVALAATQLHGSSIFLGFAVVGLLVAGFGRLIGHRFVEFGGLLMAVLAGVGFATFSDWSIDVRVGVVVCVLALAEFVVRRFTDEPQLHALPWLLPSIAFGSVFLVSQLGGASNARLGWTLAIGIAAVAIGALTQHKVLVFTGIGISAITMIVASADELRALPVWVWAMVGGLGLLVLAGVLEVHRSKQQSKTAESQVPASAVTQPVEPVGPPPQPFEPHESFAQ